MIVVTGGAGFIGSAVVWGLNRRGREDVLVVDRMHSSDKWKNLRPLRFYDFMDKQEFIQRVRGDGLDKPPRAIFHLGACSSTTEEDMDYLIRNNFHYTRDLARYALSRNIRFVYASSAATYGDGGQGYSDRHETIPQLRPLNKYGYSKQLFDQYALRKNWLDSLVGLKYFNVYGPNEYHKGEMRSVVHKSVPQAKNGGRIRLFKSHRDDVEHGQQKRDFLYVKDAVKMTLFFLDNPDVNGVYNAGVGRARSFEDLANAIFRALGKEPSIQYVDTPEEIRSNYQYFTEADLSRLRGAGYDEDPTPLEDGIDDYVNNYLLTDHPYLRPS